MSKILALKKSHFLIGHCRRTVFFLYLHTSKFPYFLAICKNDKMEMEIRVEKSRIYKDFMSGKRVSGGAARGVSFLLRETSMVGGGVKRRGHMFFSLKPH